ncbi:hypothetical protein Moror_10483 [Moniliophthora roreri MCA 2997]|uniref:DUF1772-domain-containing protein n=2 Tax=Moniliophthora roreri TaxID=221103 RepID=V2XGB6_MONRO|nr:hypothetical protein Moror_10483 [Moniliophthora roreri MCA 2997]KAI3614862.1 hypothetical protein WG66_003295 [Moniliophthora roreri]
MAYEFTTPPHASGIRIAQAVGIAGSAFVSGSILSLSWMAIPAILKSSPLSPSRDAAIQWAALYDRGHKINPSLALIASSAYFFLSWNLRRNDRLLKLYAAAGVLTIGIIPWTLGTMLDTNNKLHAKAELGVEVAEIVGEKDTEAEALIKKWGVLNALRGVLPLGGAVVGLIALLW